MADPILIQFSSDVEISVSDWRNLLYEAVDVYMQVTDSTREEFIKEIGDLACQALEHRFEDIRRIEVSDS